MSAIASEVHPDYPESDRVFLDRLGLFAKGCMVLESGRGIDGYFISHPWHRHTPVPLDTELHQLPHDPDCLYLHDIALRQTVRGSGASQTAIAHIEQLAREHDLNLVALVSLPAATRFWHMAGYETRPCDGLQSYGDDTAYMERNVNSLR
ncbi:GNAT family N-acetyltransferase [Henriciella sp.]|uniref:GNAT family N-acetyltransferase n=1 Tax=Henriciella sp. TaxID=1968823 RepID=UPI00261EEB66|nr:GNAT family N-acetyltransferase [Henriciella sp.]